MEKFMLTTLFIAIGAIAIAAAVYYQYTVRSAAMAALDFNDTLNDPLLRDCRAELDDHTLHYARATKNDSVQLTAVDSIWIEFTAGLG
jgi:hypothetical protein